MVGQKHFCWTAGQILLCHETVSTADKHSESFAHVALLAVILVTEFQRQLHIGFCVNTLAHHIRVMEGYLFGFSTDIYL